MSAISSPSVGVRASPLNLHPVSRSALLTRPVPTATMLLPRLILQSTPSTCTSRDFGFGATESDADAATQTCAAAYARARRVAAPYGVAYLSPGAASDALLTAPRVDSFKAKSAL